MRKNFFQKASKNVKKNQNDKNTEKDEKTSSKILSQ